MKKYLERVLETRGNAARNGLRPERCWVLWDFVGFFIFLVTGVADVTKCAGGGPG
jgi:hypothetical protein